MIPSKTLITGATGFIGNRLCERFKLHYHRPFRAFVRNFARACRLARMDTEMVGGDLMDSDSIRKALVGCDTVVHLAFSNAHTAVRETKNLLAACVQTKIKRFVHVSSIAVHGPAPGPECAREETAVIGSRYGEAYSDAKAAVERLVQQAMQQDNFPTVILRPGIVYGPYSPHVVRVVQSACSGKVMLIDEGRWLCNAVYIDDVCNAIQRALEWDEGMGRAFFITADHAIAWKDFILKFAEMVEPKPRILNVSAVEVREYWKGQRPTLKSNLQAFWQLLVSSDFHRQLSSVPALNSAVVSLKTLVKNILPEEQVVGLRMLAERGPNLPPTPSFLTMPDRGRLVRETFAFEFSNDLAKKVLGWRPNYGFEEGVRLTETWLRFSRLLSLQERFNSDKTICVSYLSS
jgi:nucleoside-diphosphate-sugar epimerase